jgi:hypothetical protein
MQASDPKKVTGWLSRSLYDHLIPEIQQAIDTRRRPILLTGGRGVGKTFVLSRLSIGKNTEQLSVRTSKLDRALVARLKRHRGPLVIDDIDEQLDEHGFELLEHVAEHHAHTVVVTSTLPPDVSVLHERGAFSKLPWDAEVVTYWSEVSAHMHAFRVDPWETGWRGHIASLVAEILGLKEITDFAAAWTTILLDLTGGHPTMLDAAMTDLHRMSPREGERPTEWREQYLQMEEALFSTGLRRMRKLIGWLDELDPEAGSALRRIAAGELAAADLAVEKRRVLLDSGFLYRPPSQEMAVAGEVLRRFLADGKGQRSTSIAVVETPGGGDLRAMVAHSTATVALRGAAWKLVVALTDAPRPLSLEELSEITGDDVGALRSAVQRIRSELQKLGVVGVLENVWGEGYCIGNFPLLTAKELRN